MAYINGNNVLFSPIINIERVDGESGGTGNGAGGSAAVEEYDGTINVE